LVGVPQQNIAYWESSTKPPRSDVLPLLAKILGVHVEDLLGDAAVASTRKSGPVGKLQRVFEQASHLPRRQQELVVQFVTTLLEQQKRAS